MKINHDMTMISIKSYKFKLSGFNLGFNCNLYRHHQSMNLVRTTRYRFFGNGLVLLCIKEYKEFLCCMISSFWRLLISFFSDLFVPLWSLINCYPPKRIYSVTFQWHRKLILFDYIRKFNGHR